MCVGDEGEGREWRYIIFDSRGRTLERTRDPETAKVLALGVSKRLWHFQNSRT